MSRVPFVRRSRGRTFSFLPIFFLLLIIIRCYLRYAPSINDIFARACSREDSVSQHDAFCDRFLPGLFSARARARFSLSPPIVADDFLDFGTIWHRRFIGVQLTKRIYVHARAGRQKQ